MTTNPTIPMCPPGQHDLVCHCGAGIDDHSVGDGHHPTDVGCPHCYAGVDELAAQDRGEYAPGREPAPAQCGHPMRTILAPDGATCDRDAGHDGAHRYVHPEPAAPAIVVPDTWAWTDRVAAVPSPAGQEQPSITARTADAVTGIQLLPAGAVPAGWTAGELNDPITALDIWTDPERPGRFWALNTVHGALLRLGSEVYANPDTETGQQRSLLAAVADGTVVAVVLPVVLEGWATVGLVERIEALIGCEIDWQDR